MSTKRFSVKKTMMRYNIKVSLVTGTFVLIAVLIVVVAIFFLYEQTLQNYRERLVEIVQNEARMIEALFRLNQKYMQENFESATLNELTQLQKDWKGFGETGEFLLAKLDSDEMIFFLKLRHFVSPHPLKIPFRGTNHSEPMRQALSGTSGTLIGKDYRGESVLAAYQPIPNFSLGLVAKVDISEIRAPFIKIGIWFTIGALVLTCLGFLLIRLLHKHLLLQLESNQARLNSILETAADGIITINSQGIIESINHMAEKMFGYSRKEVIGKNVNLLMPTPDHEKHDQYLQNYLKTRERKIIGIGREVTGKRKDGSVFPLDLAVGEVKLPQEIFFSGICRNITDRKFQENERKKLIEELEAKNNELERFTYTISHDLKSPLITIKGFLGFLEKDALSGHIDRIKRDSEHIHNAVDKMQHLLEDLLRLSQIGRVVSEKREIPLNALLQEVLLLLSGSIVEKKIQVQVASDLPIVFGERSRLIEVFQNLIENAIKFMGTQENPRILITASVENAYVRCSVQDNGVGIDSRHYQKIFGLFERLDSKTPGTGIGLALVKRIIEVHGGRIWVESEGIGKGTIFYFTLPQKSV
ncbi:MAG: PAS domain S-box protein [Planctomycetota bacterium]